jgi:iron(III) transport system substrate-binding protein
LLAVLFVQAMTDSSFADIGGPVDIIVLLGIAVLGAVGMAILVYTAAAAALSFVAPALAQDVSGTLVLYTSQPNADAQATVDAFTAAYPDVEVEWVRDGTTQMMARLATEFEAGSPQPDVLLIADMVTMEGLKQEGRLMAHPDADTSAYDPA